MTFTTEIDLHLRARVTLIVLVTLEEERLLANLENLCRETGRNLVTWDIAEGFQIRLGQIDLPAAPDPLSMLETVETLDGRILFVLKDFQDAWDDPLTRRKLRSTAQRLRGTMKSVIIVSPNGKLPSGLRDEAVVLEFPYPDAAELEAVLERLVNASGVRVHLTTLGREKLIQAALGLSSAQAHRAFARAIIRDGVLDDRDIDLVNAEKKQVLRESEALEFFTPGETPDDIGGLELLKDWLRLREKAFSTKARQYGLPAPKGIALIGIPGTGKSLTAKMIANLWRLPLLRLDVGALFGSLVGESEERTRRALRLVETVAPCVLWIDEMEKALAHGAGDSGTSARLFGSILTWMQEKQAPVFVVATANDILSLPPELLRKGRFDEIFFLDLPTYEERREIFAVHLRKRGRLPQDYALEQLAAQSSGYVGAEIEQAIIDAMYVGFDASREFNTQDITKALERQVPLSIAQRERVAALRQWLVDGRAQSASFLDPGDATHQFVEVRG